MRKQVRRAPPARAASPIRWRILRAPTESVPPVVTLPRPATHRSQARRCDVRSVFSASDAKSVCGKAICTASPSPGP